jgi:hypothetical protein
MVISAMEGKKEMEYQLCVGLSVCEVEHHAALNQWSGLSMVVHSCNPSYAGSRYKRIVFRGKPGWNG